jgi:tryptophanyl-tRNA synthetase
MTSASKKRVLTGITTTGSPHIGNYVGAIRPAIASSRDPNVESFYFLADLHALVKCDDPARVQQSALEIAATWLALGLDPEQVFFYRQSDIIEIPELTWYLTCLAAKGMLNRAHAYKAAVDQNTQAGDDPDAGITGGLYMYPVLMSADILVFNAHEVPVGRDQVQHIEMARDLAQRFNHVFGQGREIFTLPAARIDENTALLPGLDGRKMSKSYNNTIPLWLPQKELRRAILGIVTNSQTPGEPKDPDASHIFTIYQAFASPDETAAFRKAFRDGIAWGDAKQTLFERIDREIAPAREQYDALIAEPARIDAILRHGAEKARVRSLAFLREVRAAVGLRPLHSGAAVTKSTKPRATDATSRWLTYREKTGEFHFKLVGSDGATLFVSRGFANPQDARRAQDALFDADPQTLTRDALRTAPTDGGFRFELLLPGDDALGTGTTLSSESDAREAFARFVEAIAQVRAARAAEASH